MAILGKRHCANCIGALRSLLLTLHYIQDLKAPFYGIGQDSDKM